MNLLTQAQIGQYHREGYLLVRSFFTPGEMEHYRNAAAAYQPGAAVSRRSVTRQRLSFPSLVAHHF